MDGGIQIDGLREMTRDLQKTYGALGLTTQWMVWDQARMASNDAVKYTAPWANGKPGNSTAQKKAGHKAITAELIGKGSYRGIFGAMEETPYAATTGNWSQTAPGYSLLRYKSGAVYLVDTDNYRPNASTGELKDFHMENRTASGHTSRSKNAGSWSRNIGRWKASNKVFAKKRVIYAYVKSVQKRVGSLKASWLEAAEYFARKTNGKVSAPAWVRKQKHEGKYYSNIDKNGNGGAALISTAHHEKGIRPSFKPFIESRRNTYIREWMPKHMRTIAKRFNSGQASERAVTA